MSLVTAIQVPQSISTAIKKASKATGADFSYLLKTAERESSFNKGAKAKSSSAAGLFQFIESTWLKTVKEVGDKFGLKKYTPHIFKTRSGRHYVPNQKLRQEILQLRHNPEVSATMAGAFTQKNSEYIASQLGRAPSQGELYIAHFLGPKGAANLISKAESRPNARADRMFPRAARANKSIFYSRGKPRTVSQVYKNLVRDHAKLQETATASAAQGNVVSKTRTAEPPAAPIWNTIVTPAKQATQTAHLSKVQPGRPVVPLKSTNSAGEPVSFFSFPAKDLQPPQESLLQKVSIYPPMPVPLDGFSGVEAVILPTPNPGHSAKHDQMLGLAGQKNSPIKTPTRVAALTHTGLNIPQKTMNDAATGSLGLWTTIVRPPAIAQEVAPASPAAVNGSKPSADESENNPVKRRRSARSPGLLEQSHKRNTAQPRVQTASASRHANDDFWVQMSLNGN